MDEGPITRIVAIDGPAGAGKSSVSRTVAARLGFAFLDTGAMYRAATWWALKHGVDLDDEETLVTSTQSMPLDLDHFDGTKHVVIGGHDATELIRSAEVTERIRKLDALPGVREHLQALQRELGRKAPTVAEGRDMGTVVFPDAKCKIYLDASLEERTRRRAKQLTESGADFDLDTLRDDIHRRDEHDRNRETAPLRPAGDAYILDCTEMTQGEVVDAIAIRARSLL